MAGLGSDAPFYLTYPAWVVAQGKLEDALETYDWPEPPRWMETLHHMFHSLPVAFVAAVFIRLLSGRWPRLYLMAWVLHILIDIPTHSRQQWGPKFLWPLSDVSIDGVSWIDIILWLIGKK